MFKPHGVKQVFGAKWIKITLIGCLMKINYTFQNTK